jgi:hypothetical protein
MPYSFGLNVSASQTLAAPVGIAGWSLTETAGSTARATLRQNAVITPTAATAALNLDSTGSQITAGAHSYKVTFVTAQGETELGAISNSVTNDATHTSNTVSAIPTGPAGTTQRKVYRNKVASQTTWFALTTIADNTTTSYQDLTPDASLGSAGPSLNTTGFVFLDTGTVAANGNSTITINPPLLLSTQTGLEHYFQITSGALNGTIFET